MTEDRTTVSRLGTARALVLLAAVLAFAVSALGCVVVLVFGPILDRAGLTGTAVLAAAVCCLVVGVFALAASLTAMRARTVASVLARGFGLLLAGVVLGLASLLLLISGNS
ncbi:hypothetical protein [Actinophytocola sp.]|uniref:hypothetical protein n=1 Tax=Actinophytocola sp. TaxID=1872138 RepID=UPI003D6A0196